MMDRILPSYKMRLAKEVKQVLENNYTGRELTYYIENWLEYKIKLHFLTLYKLKNPPQF